MPATIQDVRPDVPAHVKESVRRDFRAGEAREVEAVIRRLRRCEAGWAAVHNGVRFVFSEHGETAESTSSTESLTLLCSDS